MAREPGLRDFLHMIEHGVNIDALALDRTPVGKGAHAVDELDDAVGLLADQPGQGAI